jgi:hypothetical protein
MADAADLFPARVVDFFRRRHEDRPRADRPRASSAFDDRPSGSPRLPRPLQSDFKLETDRLRMRHRFGLGGLEIASARSYQVDQVAHAAAWRSRSGPEARVALAGARSSP